MRSDAILGYYTWCNCSQWLKFRIVKSNFQSQLLNKINEKKLKLKSENDKYIYIYIYKREKYKVIALDPNLREWHKKFAKKLSTIDVADC